LASFGIFACVVPSGCAPVAAKTEPPPPRVTVQHPEQRDVADYNEYNDWTDASKTVEVRSRVRGYIHEVPFTDGQMVEEGQLLEYLERNGTTKKRNHEHPLKESQIPFDFALENRQGLSEPRRARLRR
jgi:multidrug efflux pump subunit AcrA (membrane-fusion protein)